MDIKENYLHFIWKYQLFKTQDLKTTRGESIQVLKCGESNPNQGADFQYAIIQIGQHTFHGNIELHITNGDWYTHKHQLDENYDNTILHVVYDHTDEIYTLTSQNTQIPILCLQDYLFPTTMKNIHTLIESKVEIPCQQIFKIPENIYLEQFKTRIFSDRIIRKSSWIKAIIDKNKNDYETSFYQVILYGFGIHVNSEIFLEIAQSLPQKFLDKHIHHLDKLEALLLGQANLLDAKDEYSQYLITEYAYLKETYQLKPILRKPLKSKMLPSSFPTIRLIQFAAFIHNKHGLFSTLTQFNTISEIKSYFNIEVSDYWKEHYDFGKKYSSAKFITISNSFFEKILINIILPFRFLIEIEHDHSTEKTINLYTKLKAESNTKTKKMLAIFPIQNKNAFDSQAINEWYSHYCLEKKCLECPIGYRSLK